jgi:hypothetical protein
VRSIITGMIFPLVVLDNFNDAKISLEQKTIPGRKTPGTDKPTIKKSGSGGAPLWMHPPLFFGEKETLA